MLWRPATKLMQYSSSTKRQVRRMPKAKVGRVDVITMLSRYLILPAGYY